MPDSAWCGENVAFTPGGGSLCVSPEVRRQTAFLRPPEPKPSKAGSVRKGRRSLRMRSFPGPSQPGKRSGAGFF